MKQQQMTRLLNSLPKLTHRQHQQLAAALGLLSTGSQASEIIEASAGTHPACPHCHGTAVVKNGSANALQRFKCRQCKRSFNALTATPLARLHLRDKWMAHTAALGEGLSLNQVARRLGVAQTTAFRWRHRFLACPKGVQARQLCGIAEADESYFRISCKGQRGLLRKARRRGGKALAGAKGWEYTPVLMARDRAGATANVILDSNKAASVQAALTPYCRPIRSCAPMAASPWQGPRMPWASSTRPSTSAAAYACAAPGMCKTSMPMSSAACAGGCAASRASPPSTSTPTWGGFGCSIVSRPPGRSPLLCLGWLSGNESITSIREKSHI